MDKYTRKRKAYYNSSHPNKKPKGGVLSVDMKGFFCTCNSRTRDCTREAYNILNEYYEKLHPEEKESVGGGSDETRDEDDIDLKKEVDAIKNENKMNRKFQYMDPGVNSCVFIKTVIEDPVGMAHTIMKDIAKEKECKTKFLLRMVPVEVVCKAYLQDIKKVAEKLFDSYFKGDPKTFAIVLNRRSNSSVVREEVIESLANIVKDKNAHHKADLKNADLTIIVEIVKNLCCLSVVPDFIKLKKYNLVELGNSK